MHISLPRSRTEGRGQADGLGVLQCTQTPFDTYVDKRETLQACVCMHGTTGQSSPGRQSLDAYNFRIRFRLQFRIRKAWCLAKAIASMRAYLQIMKAALKDEYPAESYTLEAMTSPKP